MITGIIYRYISPNGKCYVGQTTNELYRRRMWFGTGRYTGGISKIDRARKNMEHIISSMKYCSRETSIH